MTSPPEEIEVTCRRCGHRWETWWRPSINLTLGEEWTEEEIRALTFAVCPSCGQVADLSSLIVE